MRQAAPTRAVILATVAMVQHGFILLMIGPVLPDIMETFGIQESRVGVMLGLGSLGFILGPPLAGALADRYGVRLSLALGFVVEIAALGLMTRAPVFAAVVILSVATRFGAAFIETGANIIPSLVASERRGSLMNLVHTFFGVGALSAPIVAGWILRRTGSWRPVFWFPAAVTVVVLVFMAFTPLPAPPPRRERVPVRAVINPVVLLGSLTLFLYVGAEVGVSSWIVLYLRRDLGFPTLLATGGLTVLWLGIMVGRYLNSLLARRWGASRLVIGAGIAGMVFGELMLLARGPIGMYISLGLFGLVVSGVFPHVMAEINGRYPGRAGAVTAVLAVASSAGAMTLHPILGAIAESVGLRAAIALPGVLMGLTAVSYGLCARRLRTEP